MAISTEQIKALLQSSDIAAIRSALDEIALSENEYGESAAQQEQLLKLQIMLQSRILSIQQSQGVEESELCATYRRVASLWMRAGEIERSVGQLEKALALNNEDTEALQLTARAMLNLAKYTEAVHTQEKAIELIEQKNNSSDSIVSAHYQLASIYEAMGEFRRAIELLRKLTGRDNVAESIQAEIYSKLGVICEKLGEDQQAVDSLSKAHELYVRTIGQSHSKTQEVAYLLEMASSGT